MEEMEIYEVMYTKHINQKIKSWEEGLFEYNLKNFKAVLFNNPQKENCIDSKYMRIKPDFYPDEQFKMNKFLVMIEKRVWDKQTQKKIDEQLVLDK